jgi:hypothetical protein
MVVVALNHVAWQRNRFGCVRLVQKESGDQSPHSKERRGIAVFVVLLVIAMTLGLSYAMVRTQSTALRIHRNSGRGTLARHAAVTGMTMAIKTMNTSTWAGVGTTLTGTLGPYESYKVTYTTGDASLTAASPLYNEYPYRVTLLSTGSSVDPDNPQSVATHQVRAVLRLVPRKLADEPSQWAYILNYTVYQWSLGTWNVAVPSRIEGPVRVKGAMAMSLGPASGGCLNPELNWPDSVRRRYYSDLKRMRDAYGTDWRAYSATATFYPYTWDWPLNWIQSDAASVLTSMGTSTSNTGFPSSNVLYPPASLTTYQLYPGGKVYNVQAVASTLQNATLQPDVLLNPAGIYWQAGQVELGDGATLCGTLITPNANVNVRGKGVKILAADLPSLYGTSQPVQLPAVVAGGRFYVFAGAEVGITGMVTASTSFDVASDTQDRASLTLLGALAAGDISIHGRSEWTAKSTNWWNDKFLQFDAQASILGGVKYFPEWLQAKKHLDPTPRLTIKPSPTPIRYHWHTWTDANGTNNPIFVPDPNDGGLRWNLLDWTDSP